MAGEDQVRLCAVGIRPAMSIYNDKSCWFCCNTTCIGRPLLAATRDAQCPSARHQLTAIEVANLKTASLPATAWASTYAGRRRGLDRSLTTKGTTGIRGLGRLQWFFFASAHHIADQRREGLNLSTYARKGRPAGVAL